MTGKGALIGLTRSLPPGPTRTASTAYQPDEAFEASQAGQALPRALTPEDVSATVGFLASAAAEALTGQILTVDGGGLFT
ncbi:SDR family oxidoreductase [Streptomyces sp. NPDC007901]|uniref:SDR family oxidoreductase n=1 Tax=Streptomyces sp. NPDC007901 TaxID=3364785 RepID=UPI0036E5296C